ncbi:odorant receptor 23a [Drosophila tropicalis]|uniref:odorant receptor 23a n=1 Tax=Drosophila tropicalis TaxID=46794 RepID=UPI0035AB8740
MENTNKKTIEHFRVCRSIWHFLGAFSLNARKYGNFFTVFHIFAGFLLPLSLLRAIGSFGTPMENITNFCMAVTSVSTSLKFLCYMAKMDTLEQLERILGQLDARVNGSQQGICLWQMVKQNRILCNLYLVIYITLTIFTEISVCLRSGRSLIFPGWFPLDWSESVVNYSLALTFQCVGIFIQIMENMVDDLFPPLALNLIAGQCELLALRISVIGHNKNDDQRANEKELINCIRDQEKLYRLFKLTMEIISWPMLIQFIVIAIDFGTSMFTLIFYAKTPQDRFFFTFFLIGLNCEIFPVCYIGANVDFQFDRLHYAIFCSNWINQSRQYRQNALVLAERTKKRPLLLAGHMVPIHLTTFMANCKAAYSIFTLIGDAGNK